MVKTSTNISILGSTGSIGTQTLEVAEALGLRVVALTAHTNSKLLAAQARKYRPEMVAVMDEDAACALETDLAGEGIPIYAGMDGIMAAAVVPGADTVVNSLVGNIGLRPTMAAIEAGKTVALANKETLVAAGELITRLATEKKTALYPIDSEHSAIFQCLRGNEGNSVRKIHLTASGGPFRGRTFAQMREVTPTEALKHPNWTMGAKITIDSATMMNKGLEVIEAKWLFGLVPEQIQVLVHPQSVVHSMVEFCDGAVMAQLGEPDMRVPIAYALTYPRRMENQFPKIDFLLNNILTFEAPDLDSFPCLRLAYEAMTTGGTMPAVMNAANEAAVGLFLAREISFCEIPALIEKSMNAYTIQNADTLSAILAADEWGRTFVLDHKR